MKKPAKAVELRFYFFYFYFCQPDVEDMAHFDLKKFEMSIFFVSLAASTLTVSLSVRHIFLER